MVETRRLKELRSRSTALLRLPDGDLVVALSGGADSAALAYLLVTLGRVFRAVHVNHGLPASDRLEEAAGAVARSIGVELDVVGIEIPPGASLEGQARKARYAALLASMLPGETLLTAHTLDDQAETVLMNLLRGSGPTGLTGVTRESGALARPMLAISRSETRELSALALLPFFDDPSNLDRGLRRNAIRLEVIPQLSARFNPRLVEALARFAELIGADEAHLRHEADAVPVMGDARSLALPIGVLSSVARPVAIRAIRRCLALVRPPHGGSAAELDDIWAVATRDRTSVSLTGGVEVAHEGPLLYFRSGGIGTRPMDRVELVVGSNQVGSFHIDVERIDRACRVAPIGLWSAVFPGEVALGARIDERRRLVVDANAADAWVVGERRLPIAWYEPGTSGYLSVFAREGNGWTSSP
jgi:tRNA(Ile)-lysidine synthetase-like protein